MAKRSALTELRSKELMTLKGRVERRIKFKPGPKRIRRVAGVDIVLTPQASKVHVCACLMSFPKMQVLEEAIATDEMDAALHRSLGAIVLVPLVLSVLKMLKHKVDVVMMREMSLKEEIPLSSYVGVIAGRPSIGISESHSSLKNLSKWDGSKRAGAIRVRRHKTTLGVIAGHLMTFKDASSLARACIKETRLPEPIRSAGKRVRAWEREWRRINL